MTNHCRCLSWCRASAGSGTCIKGADETCDVRVLRVTAYDDFEALLDSEGPERVNPMASRDEQLAAIRSIYPPEKEALGALVIEMQLLAQ